MTNGFQDPEIIQSLSQLPQVGQTPTSAFGLPQGQQDLLSQMQALAPPAPVQAQPEASITPFAPVPLKSTGTAPGDVSAPVQAFKAETQAKIQQLIQAVGPERAQRIMGRFGPKLMDRQGQLEVFAAKEDIKRQSKLSGLGTKARNDVESRLVAGKEAISRLDLAQSLYNPQFSTDKGRILAAGTGVLANLFGAKKGSEIAGQIQDFISTNLTDEAFGPDIEDIRAFRKQYGQWKATVQETAQRFRHMITGAQAGFKEIQHLIDIIPSINDDQDIYAGKNVSIREIEKRLSKFYSDLLVNGIDFTKDPKTMSPEKRSVFVQLKQESGILDLAAEYTKQFGHTAGQ